MFSVRSFSGESNADHAGEAEHQAAAGCRRRASRGCGLPGEPGGSRAAPAARGGHARACRSGPRAPEQDGKRPGRLKEPSMSVFSDKELYYLADRRLGRLATVDPDGLPHVVPLGWSYNPALDTIDIGGRDFARTAKFRNIRANPRVALVIDDVLPPWRPRCVMVRGEAEALDEAAGADGGRLGPIIRIHPSQVLSWGLDTASP